MTELERGHYEYLCDRLGLYAHYTEDGSLLWNVYELLDLILDKVEEK